MTAVQEIFEKARTMSPEEREQLAHLLLESLDVDPQEEVDAAWETEIDRRIAEVEAGTAEIVSGDEALMEIEAKLRARRAGK
jgi:putative addiction module component (TIGR02574 family)